MCGICGIYNYRAGEPASRRLVEAMAGSIRHRGPDDEGHGFVKKASKLRGNKAILDFCDKYLKAPSAVSKR